MFRLIVDRRTELHLLETWHAPLLFALIDRNREFLRQWLPWLDASTTVDDSLSFIDAARERHAHREGLDAGLWHDGVLTGMLSFNEIDWTHRRATLGYWLGAEFQGRGLMTRSCRTLIGHGFAELGLNRLEIRCSPHNRRSCAIAERLGFTREGVIRQAEWLYDHFEDQAIYGLLASEWPPTSEGKKP